MFLRKLLRIVVATILLLLIVIFAFRNKNDMLRAFDSVGQASLPMAVGALLLVVCGIAAAAKAYQTLAIKKLPFQELLVVEMAALFAGRILPGGIGGMGVHGLYLHKKRHTISQSTAIVTTNNMLGFFVHFLLLSACLLYSPKAIAGFQLECMIFVMWLLLGVVVVLCVAFSLQSVRRVATHWKSELSALTRSYATHPTKLVSACAYLMVIPCINLAVLWLAGQQIAPEYINELNLASLFIIFSMGVLVGASTPTPGGLAGVEAGLVAGFTMFNLGLSDAIAATLLFRLATYWMPLLPGAYFLWRARQMRLL